MRLVILQPGYLPWLGFFDQMKKADTFVILDDVQYDKRSWRNRNKIKSRQGATWLTVPVKQKGLQKQLILETRIDNSMHWQRKQLQTIIYSYKKAPYFNECFPDIEKILTKKWDFLLDLDMAFIVYFNALLGITSTLVRSSQVEVGGQKANYILNICDYFNTNQYLTGDLAINYLDEEKFKKKDISLLYHNYSHPVYPQLFGEFISHLSVMDMVMNYGAVSGGALFKA